jgi:hypothetical protein
MLHQRTDELWVNVTHVLDVGLIHAPAMPPTVRSYAWFAMFGPVVPPPTVVIAVLLMQSGVAAEKVAFGPKEPGFGGTETV